MLATTTATATVLTQFFSNVPLDLVIVLVLFIIGAVDGYLSGGARVSAAALALPLAILAAGMAQSAFALGATLHTIHADAYPAATIGVLFVALFFIIGRMVEQGFGAGGPISALLAGLGAVAVILALWMATPALAALVPLGYVVPFFFGEAYRLYWLVGGYVALALARG